MKGFSFQCLRIAFYLLPLLFLSNFGNSQTHTKKTVSIPNGRCNGYWEYLPINYNSNTTAKYPLIIYIHGAGSYGNGSSSALDLVAREGVTRIINLNLFPSTFIVNGQVTSFIAISPQFISKPTPQEIGKVIDFILNRGYRIDSKRIYLTGFSNGGDGVWKAPYNLAAAERLTAIIPVAGYNSPYYDTTAKFIAAGNLPVWAVHSPSDGVPILWTTNMVNKIKSFNPQVPPVFTKPAGLTHEQTHEVVYDPSYRPNGKNFYEWCLQYTRNVNAPPLANAGNDLTITYPLRQVTLNGNASSDPDNDPLVYSWRKTTGPSSFNFNNSSISNPTVSNLVAGTYQFELTVTDIANNSDKDSVLVTVVNPTPNILPIAIAENDITIATPMPISLIGSNSYDIDGIIETYFWSKISGPSQFTIQNPALSNTGISNLRAGIYKFQLLVSDNQGGTGFDTVVITVLNNLPNIPPIANAGSDQTITLPLNSVSLSGNGSSDIDGNIVSYFWRQINGPSNAALGSPDNSTTNAGNLLVGTYQFELTVMDDSTSSDKDTVQIGVNPIPVVTQKFIKVNIYGGSFPAGTGWNNWNVLNNLTLGSTTYSDGTNSSMTAVLNLSSAVSDNGSTYPVTMCPIEVGRTTSYSTVVRTITLSGLNNNREYSLEVYASRAKTGNSTRFTVGSSSVSINTDYNYSNKALFTSITPVNGKVVLKIERLANYNYINGFILTELDGSPPPNQSPVAVAGNSQTITLPNSSVTLNGSLSYDPDGTIVSYNWTKLSGPSAVINSNNSAITTVSQLTQGVYLFQLTVTDNIGATASSNVQVIVNEEYIPPVGQDSLNCGKIFKIVVLGSSTAIGTGATPIDSAWVNKMRFYVRGKNLQSQIINLAASGFTTYHTLNPTGFIPLPGRPEPDSNRNITKALSYSPDLIIINLPSNDNASNFSVQEQMDNYERAMALANSNNTPVWVTTPQPRNNFNSTQVSNQLAVRDWTLQRFAEKAIDFWEGIANPDGTINELYNFDGIHVNTAGHHIFYSRAVAERMLDTLCLRKNTEPIAKAGNDVSILFPLDSLQLNGTGSTDPDGSIVSYQWLKINGPSCTIINPSSAITMITGMHVGVYEFQVKVTDNYGAVSFDSVTATVTSPIPQPPVANAGMDTVLILPVNNTQLNGTGSFDPDGTITSYNWREVAGSSTYLLTDSLSAIANVTDMEAGIYIFELTVLDSNGMFDLDSVTITVAEPPNQPPDANAGVDLVIAYPGTAAQLNGSLSVDSDGTIVGYMWTKISGPIPFAIDNISIQNPLISGLVSGIYVMELMVIDNEGAIGKDSVTINIGSAPNQSPVADAGSDEFRVLPANSVLLNGNNSADPDGNIVSYHWIKVAGPASYSFNNPNLANPVISNLIAGIYVIELTVTDNNGAIDKDSVVITVYPPLNTLPIANAGTDQVITLPVNSVTLNGSASFDNNGIITSYQWQQLTGPSLATINSSFSSITNAGNLLVGTYQFELTVMDDSTSSDKDTVQIVVSPIPVVTQKFIKVNMYGGSFPAGTGWNNWNVLNNLTLGSTTYSDGTNSSMTAVLNLSSAVSDNGSTYPVAMCPIEVGRTTSYSTVVRTITLSGLDNNREYSLEVYGSRAKTGNSTRFTVGSSSVSINTDYNYSNKALFTSITPVNGKVVLKVERLNTYNYINGFMLIENEATGNRSAGYGNELITQTETINETELDHKTQAIVAYPNPTDDISVITFNSPAKGTVMVSIFNMYGRLVREYQTTKEGFSFAHSLSLHGQPKGVYFVKFKINDIIKIAKIFKQ